MLGKLSKLVLKLVNLIFSDSYINFIYFEARIIKILKDRKGNYIKFSQSWEGGKNALSIIMVEKW